MRAAACLLGLMLAVVPGLAGAQSAQDKADLARVEAYLNGITTMKAHFVQSEENGAALEGTLYLQRPGKLRFEFIPPPGPYTIIADGDQLNYVAHGALTQVSIEATPLSVLIAKQISFQQNLTLASVQRAPAALTFNFIQTKNPQGEKLAVTFQDKPLRLARWAITYKSGRAVTVALTDLQTGIAIDPKLFVYQAPFTDQQRSNRP